jgi:bifunctional DNA-binding transcriptional regulator/antitoxin component of YhaV-PrlF toxin-antitoxin module
MGTTVILSKLTRKYQATIPGQVRKALGVERGDRIAFEVEKNLVRLRKAGPLEIEYLKALEPTLGEWSSRNDENAYRSLGGR